MSRPGFSSGDLAAIAVGGAAGATVRWSIDAARDIDDHWVHYEAGLPWWTLVANLSGCLLLGYLTLLLTRHTTETSRRLLVGSATGFCGSLTTFSTFAVEAANLLRNTPQLRPRPTEGYLVASPPATATTGVVYVAISVVGGALAFWLGRLAAGRLPERSTQ